MRSGTEAEEGWKSGGGGGGRGRARGWGGKMCAMCERARVRWREVVGG